MFKIIYRFDCIMNMWLDLHFLLCSEGYMNILINSMKSWGFMHWGKLLKERTVEVAFIPDSFLTAAEKRRYSVSSVNGVENEE